MMELWKDSYLLERENRNRDGEWLEIAQRKAARAEGKPVSKMPAEQWQRLYGPPIPHKGNIRPPQSTPMPAAPEDRPPWDE
jgi:hypothetical protein